MTRTFLLLACLSGASAVALGAFGAHILKKVLSEHQLQIYQTAVQYQFYHTLALVAVAILARHLSKRWIAAAGWLFVAGMAFFSGSLYLLALSESLGLISFQPILGPMTPIGGLLFIGGWVALFLAGNGYRTKTNRSKKTEE